MIWSLAATVCLALLGLSGAWMDIFENAVTLRDDVREGYSQADLRNNFAWGDPSQNAGMVGGRTISWPMFLTKGAEPFKNIELIDPSEKEDEYASQEARVVWATTEDTPIVQTGQHPSLSVTKGRWDKVLVSEEKVFIAFIVPWCRFCQRLAPTWESFSAAAKEASLPFRVATVNCVDEPDLCREQTILAFPTLRWYEHGKQAGTDYTPSRDRTVAAFMAYSRSQLAGTYERDYEQQYLPRGESLGYSTSEDYAPEMHETQAEEPLPKVESESEHRLTEHHSLSLTSENWDRVVASQQTLFVNLFAPWCVWCQRLAPTWENFSVAAKEASLPIMVAKVDCVAEPDLCRQQKIMAFPTMRWYENGKQVGTDYKQERTVPALLAYSRSHLAGTTEQDYERGDPPQSDETLGYSESEDYPYEMDERETEEQSQEEDGTDDMIVLDDRDRLETVPSDEESSSDFVALHSAENRDRRDSVEDNNDEISVDVDIHRHDEGIFQVEVEESKEEAHDGEVRETGAETQALEDIFEDLVYEQKEEPMAEAVAEVVPMDYVTNSVEATSENWDHLLASSPDVFVFFGVAWCRHSRRYMPTWEEFAGRANQMGLPLAVARVDCVTDECLCTKQDIRQYPTGRWYHNGQPVFDFESEDDLITSESLMRFAQDRLSEFREIESTVFIITVISALIDTTWIDTTAPALGL